MKSFAVFIVVFVTLFFTFCAVQELQAQDTWTGLINATADPRPSKPSFSQDLFFGVNLSATDGFDKPINSILIDKVAIPLPPGSPLDISFPCSDPIFDKLIQDIRKTSDTVTWKLNADAPSVGFTLTWDLSGVPNFLYVKMDIGDGTIVDMRNESSHHFNKGSYRVDNDPENSIKIMVTPKPSVEVTNPTNATKIKGGDNYTIKWNAGGTGVDHFRIQYLVNGGAPVDIGTVASGIREYLWTTPNNVNSSQVRVKAIAENASNGSLASDESDDFMIDSTAPITSISLNPPSPNGENDWYTSNVEVTLTATDNLSGVDKTYYRINGGAWQEYTTPFTVIGTTVDFYSKDKVVKEETPFKSQLIQIDKTPPTDPSNVTDDGATTFSKTQLHATWGSSTDLESLVKEYFYCIGTTPGASDVRDWTSIGSVTEKTATGLSLEVGKTYYFSVKAKNFAGLESGVASSDGITVLPSNLEATKPTGLEKIRGGDVENIQWTFAGTGVDHFRIQYLVNGGTPIDIGTAASGIREYLWTTPNNVNSLQVRVKVIAEDTGNGSLASDESDDFMIDSTPPVTSISLNPSSPNGYNGWYTSNVEVTLTATDNLSGVDKTYYRINGGAWQEYTTPFTVIGTTVDFYSKDKVVKEETPFKSQLIKIDKTPPTDPSNVTDDGDTIYQGVPLHFKWNSSTDPESGITGYFYCVGTTAGGNDVQDWTYNSVGEVSTPIALVVGNTYYCSVKAKNFAGIESVSASSDGIKVLPKALEVTNPSGGDKIKGGNNVNIKWTYGGPPADHFRIEYAFDLNAPQNIGTVSSASTEISWTTPKIDSSSVNVKVIAENASNNEIMNGNCNFFMIDSTKPVTNIALNPINPNGGNGWYTSDVVVTLAANDSLSGVDKIYYTINGGTQQEYTVPFTVTGSAVQYWSKDMVGNVEDKNSKDIHIDKTPPTDPTKVNDEGDTTFSKDSLYVSWDASTDAQSGIQSYQVFVGDVPNVDDKININGANTTGTNYTFTGLNLEVDHTYYMAVRAKNNAGLWSGVGRTDGIKRIPSSIVVTDPKGGDNIKGGTVKTIKWDYSGDPNVTGVHHFLRMYSTDGGVNYSPVLPSTIVLATSATSYQCSWNVPSINSASVRVKIIGERTNNTEAMSGFSGNLTIDITVPVTTIGLTGPLGTNGWYTGDVTVTLTATDNLSGVGKTFYNIDKGANGPWLEYTNPFPVPGPTTVTGSTVWYYSVDKALPEGNKETAKSSQLIKIEKPDTNKPVVKDDGEKTGSKTQLHATWTYTAPKSGLAEYQYCIGTTSGGNEVKNWTTTGTSTQVTATGLNLIVGTKYYFGVKAKSGAGTWSGVGTSDGITVVNDIIINAKAGNGGSIDPSGDSSGNVLVTAGTDQKFTMDPDKGYEVYRLLVDGKSVGAKSSYTFNKVTDTHTIEVKFTLIQYAIDAVVGIGGTISPSGSTDVDYGDDQTFTISPSVGYKISDVKVDGTSLGAITTHTFSNVKDDHTISATFAVTDHTITATTGANGAISPSGAVTVPDGTSKTFSMTPSNGYRVNDVKVDGSSVGSVSTYTFTNVTSNRTIDVSFVPSTYTLTATSGANGAISPSGATVAIYGADQSYTITPVIGYHVADVKVDSKSVGAVTTYKFTSINSNHTIDASFAINIYTITASAGSNGTISPSGVAMVNHGANQTFTMTPSQWYHVADVKVDGQSVGAVTTYAFTSVTSNHTIEASFAIDTYTITATAGSGGTISPSGAVAVNRGDNKAFSIAPSAGYHIVDVKIDSQSVGTIIAYTFTSVTTNHTIEASFAINTYTLKSLAESGGTISPSGTATVNYGSNQTYTITPNEGYKLSSILVDGSQQAVSGTYTFSNISADHSILAKFEVQTFTINTRSGLHGFIWPATMPMSKEMLIPAKYGETKLFTITSDAGYHVADVKADGTSVGAVDTYTFTDIKSNHVLEATFDVNTYKITVTANDGGTISPSGDVSVNYGLNQTFTMTLSEWHHVADVKVDGTSVGVLTTYEFKNVTSDHTIEAVFAVDTHTIKATANAGGTITPSGSVPVNYGADQEFTIASSDNYHLVDVKVDGSSVGKVTTYKFTNVIVDHTIEAVFAIDTHVITAKAGANGTISPSGLVNVNHGADQTFTITPSDGYHVLDVLVDEKSVGAVTTYKFTKVTEAHSIEATFAVTEYVYIITASAGDGGTITPSGDVKVKKGDKQTFEMTPDAGYVIQDVKIDGQSMSNIGKYVFVNVTSNHIISVKFRLFDNNVKLSALLPNFPNPFNPETWIPFQLKDDSDVTIKVYNVKGELVRELNLGHKASGSYLIRDKAAYWDGKNASGERVASGIYFYNIKAGDFSATKKMIVKK